MRELVRWDAGTSRTWRREDRVESWDEIKMEMLGKGEERERVVGCWEVRRRNT